MDLVDAIMAFEADQLDDRGTLELFSGLVKSGQVWSLQGDYGRFAKWLVKRGWLTEAGEITEMAKEALDEVS